MLEAHRKITSKNANYKDLSRIKTVEIEMDRIGNRSEKERREQNNMERSN
jgi:hypothetical protein